MAQRKTLILSLSKHVPDPTLLWTFGTSANIGEYGPDLWRRAAYMNRR